MIARDTSPEALAPEGLDTSIPNSPPTFENEIKMWKPYQPQDTTLLAEALRYAGLPTGATPIYTKNKRLSLHMQSQPDVSRLGKLKPAPLSPYRAGEHRQVKHNEHGVYTAPLGSRVDFIAQSSTFTNKTKPRYKRFHEVVNDSLFLLRFPEGMSDEDAEAELFDVFYGLRDAAKGNQQGLRKLRFAVEYREFMDDFDINGYDFSSPLTGEDVTLGTFMAEYVDMHLPHELEEQQRDTKIAEIDGIETLVRLLPESSLVEETPPTPPIECLVPALHRRQARSTQLNVALKNYQHHQTEATRARLSELLVNELNNLTRFDHEIDVKLTDAHKAEDDVSDPRPAKTYSSTQRLTIRLGTNKAFEIPLRQVDNNNINTGLSLAPQGLDSIDELSDRELEQLLKGGSAASELDVPLLLNALKLIQLEGEEHSRPKLNNPNKRAVEPLRTECVRDELLTSPFTTRFRAHTKAMLINTGKVALAGSVLTGVVFGVIDTLDKKFFTGAVTVHDPVTEYEVIVNNVFDIGFFPNDSELEDIDVWSIEYPEGLIEDLAPGKYYATTVYDLGRKGSGLADSGPTAPRNAKIDPEEVSTVNLQPLLPTRANTYTPIIEDGVYLQSDHTISPGNIPESLSIAGGIGYSPVHKSYSLSALEQDRGLFIIEDDQFSADQESPYQVIDSEFRDELLSLFDTVGEDVTPRDVEALIRDSLDYSIYDHTDGAFAEADGTLEQLSALLDSGYSLCNTANSLLYDILKQIDSSREYFLVTGFRNQTAGLEGDDTLTSLEAHMWVEDEYGNIYDATPSGTFPGPKPPEQEEGSINWMLAALISGATLGAGASIVGINEAKRYVSKTRFERDKATFEAFVGQKVGYEESDDSLVNADDIEAIRGAYWIMQEAKYAPGKTTEAPTELHEFDDINLTDISSITNTLSKYLAVQGRRSLQLNGRQVKIVNSLARFSSQVRPNSVVLKIEKLAVKAAS